MQEKCVAKREGTDVERKEASWKMVLGAKERCIEAYKERLNEQFGRMM